MENASTGCDLKHSSNYILYLLYLLRRPSNIYNMTESFLLHAYIRDTEDTLSQEHVRFRGLRRHRWSFQLEGFLYKLYPYS